MPCVPPAHDVVVILNEPPPEPLLALLEDVEPLPEEELP
jgi:hypothetical protein